VSSLQRTAPSSQRLRLSRALALIGGVLLPILETLRRWGTWWDEPASFVDDWLIGAFLLTGVWLTRSPAARKGLSVLTAAWGFACGMLYPSIAGQWQAMQAGEADPAPIPSGAVLVVKIVLGLGALAGLVLALTASERAAFAETCSRVTTAASTGTSAAEVARRVSS
jgi:hypothetical protein